MTILVKNVIFIVICILSLRDFHLVHNLQCTLFFVCIILVWLIFLENMISLLLSVFSLFATKHANSASNNFMWLSFQCVYMMILISYWCDEKYDTRVIHVLCICSFLLLWSYCIRYCLASTMVFFLQLLWMFVMFIMLLILFVSSLILLVNLLHFLLYVWQDYLIMLEKSKTTNQYGDTYCIISVKSMKTKLKSQ